MKTVILFYSRTRKTALAAQTLSSEVGADLIEITDLVDRIGSLNYMNSLIDAIRENKTKIKPENIDLSKYGLVYIGGPTWTAKPTPAIITLVDQCDLQGKDIILFTTMRNRGGHQVIERMREKIEARGGRMVSSFILKQETIVMKISLRMLKG
ncbi:MAG TPA: flavodoxin [Methanobacteriaceae archaeon]|nr:flavodoxin [Methanobacteriaceae archaeon]